MSSPGSTYGSGRAGCGEGLEDASPRPDYLMSSIKRCPMGLLVEELWQVNEWQQNDLLHTSLNVKNTQVPLYHHAQRLLSGTNRRQTKWKWFLEHLGYQFICYLDINLCIQLYNLRNIFLKLNLRRDIKPSHIGLEMVKVQALVLLQNMWTCTRQTSLTTYILI